MDEKKEIGDILFGIKRKWDNFWYHYKVAFIFGVLILAFLIFAVTQCVMKEKGDANVAYIGWQEFGVEAYNDFQTALSEILAEDLNGDEKIKIDFSNFSYMTSSQLEIASAQGKIINIQDLLNVQTQINLELISTNILIYFLDPKVYEELASPGIFMDLEDSLGYTPDNANDIYSIRLGSLPCWSYYPGLNNLPADTVIAIRELRLSEENNEKILALYERNLKMFKKIIDFKY